MKWLETKQHLILSMIYFPTLLFRNLDTHNCLNIENLKIRSEIDAKSKRPKQFHTTLIELLGISSEKVYSKFLSGLAVT
jgi:hypothetical protein